MDPVHDHARAVISEGPEQAAESEAPQVVQEQPVAADQPHEGAHAETRQEQPTQVDIVKQELPPSQSAHDAALEEQPVQLPSEQPMPEEPPVKLVPEGDDSGVALDNPQPAEPAPDPEPAPKLEEGPATSTPAAAPSLDQVYEQIMRQKMQNQGGVVQQQQQQQPQVVTLQSQLQPMLRGDSGGYLIIPPGSINLGSQQVFLAATQSDQQVLRTTTMENILHTINAAGSIDSNLFAGWTSLPADRVLEGLSSVDVKAINVQLDQMQQQHPQAVMTVGTSGGVDTSLSPAPQQLPVLTSLLSLGALTAQAGPSNSQHTLLPPHMVVYAASQAQMGETSRAGVLKRTRSGQSGEAQGGASDGGRTQHLVAGITATTSPANTLGGVPAGAAGSGGAGQAGLQPTTTPPSNSSPSLVVQQPGPVGGASVLKQEDEANAVLLANEADVLERENQELQSQLDMLLLQLHNLQQENNQMKMQLLDTCSKHGIKADMSQLNATIALHRTTPMSDEPATMIAVSALTQNKGDIIATVRQLLGAAVTNARNLASGLDGNGKASAPQQQRQAQLQQQQQQVAQVLASRPAAIQLNSGSGSLSRLGNGTTIVSSQVWPQAVQGAHTMMVQGGNGGPLRMIGPGQETVITQGHMGMGLAGQHQQDVGFQDNRLQGGFHLAPGTGVALSSSPALQLPQYHVVQQQVDVGGGHMLSKGTAGGLQLIQAGTGLQQQQVYGSLQGLQGAVQLADASQLGGAAIGGAGGGCLMHSAQGS